MNPDKELVDALIAIIKSEECQDWMETLRAYKTACRLSRPMCEPTDRRIDAVLRRAAHWHHRALLLEQSIRVSLAEGKEQPTWHNRLKVN